MRGIGVVADHLPLREAVNVWSRSLNRDHNHIEASSRGSSQEVVNGAME